jgi:hypothetical protein
MIKVQRRRRSRRPDRRQLGPAHPPGHHRGGRYGAFEDSSRASRSEQTDESPACPASRSSIRKQRRAGQGPAPDGHAGRRQGRRAEAGGTNVPRTTSCPPGRSSASRRCQGRRRRRAGAYPAGVSKTRDITGGLPRVADLFEARKPKEPAILAEATGTVSFGKETKGKQRLVITPTDDGETVRESLIPKWRHVSCSRASGREGRDDLRGRTQPARHPAPEGRHRAGRSTWSRRSRTSIGCRA